MDPYKLLPTIGTMPAAKIPGREKEITQLLRLLRAKSVFVEEMRRMGKSMLLLKLTHLCNSETLPQEFRDDKFSAQYFSFQGKQNLGELIDFLIAELEKPRAWYKIDFGKTYEVIRKLISAPQVTAGGTTLSVNLPELRKSWKDIFYKVLDDIAEAQEKNKGSHQVQVIHQLVKGNHRLLVTFYEFLKGDTLAKLSSNFIKTINDLKPYYETYIRYLPPQQQKILRYIALSRKPQQGTEIQRNCFIDQKSLSKQLSELVKKRLLESIPDPSDKRNKFYDIEEPLLRISIEVGEHKEGITALFLDFLALYYEEDELKNKIGKVSDLLTLCEENSTKKEFLYEINAIKRALEIQRTDINISKKTIKVLTEINEAIDDSKYDLVLQILKRDGNHLPKDERNSLKGFALFMNDEYKMSIETLRNVSIEKLKSTGSLLAMAYACMHIAIQEDNFTLFEECIPYLEAFEKDQTQHILLEEVYQEWGRCCIHFAIAYNDDNLYNAGVEKLHRAVISSGNRPLYSSLNH